MKKLIVGTVLIAFTSLSTFAQGTVSFQNFIGATGRVYYNPLFIHSTNGASLAAAGYTVALLAGPVGTPVSSLTAVATFTSTTGGGQFFDGATITIPGISAGTGSADTTQNVELVVEAWLGNFATYNAAESVGSPDGMTIFFNNPTGGGGTPSATSANLVGWTSSNPLIMYSDGPEPSTIAVGGLGAVMALFFHRRKNGLPPPNKINQRNSP